MPGIVEVMWFGVVATAVTLFLGSMLYAAALVRLLLPLGGVDRMPIPPAGVPEHGALVADRIRTHLRDRAGLPTRSTWPPPETMRLHLILGRGHAENPERAAA